MPLKSTREEVERALGVPQLTNQQAAYYRFRDELAVVWFQARPFDQCGFGWNVPPGTVTTIGVIPLSSSKAPKSLEGFKVRDATAGLMYFTSDQEGLTIETFNGRVTSFKYEPDESLASLACVPKDCIADPHPKFDEYQNLRWSDEKARLDNFAIHLKENLLRGAIVVYGKSESQRAALIKHAGRARQHLTSLGLESARILVLDGGYREWSAFELHRYSIGSFMHEIYLWPEKDPQPSKHNVTKPNRRSGGA